MKKLLVVALCFVAMTSCGQVKKNKKDNAASQKVSTVEAYGSKITTDGAVSINQLATLMGDKTELNNLKIYGNIEECCSKKGCWMKVKDGKMESPVRVSFKDYAFFVPLNSAGKKVVMEGKAFVKETSVDDLRHYAEDAGKSKEEIEKITEPKRELLFEATGIELKK